MLDVRFERMHLSDYRLISEAQLSLTRYTVQQWLTNDEIDQVRCFLCVCKRI